MKRLSGGPFLALAVLMGWLSLAPFVQAQSKVAVKGLGFFQNKTLEQRLAFLSGEDESVTQELTYADVEDSAYLLLQLLKREGYPNPRVNGLLEQAESPPFSVTWELPFVSQASPALEGGTIDRVKFICDPGLLSFYRSIEIEGLTALDAELAQDFFLPSGVLFTSRTDRAFTNANFESRINRLLAVLRSKGHRQARIGQREIKRDPDSGAVNLRLVVEEGPVFRVGRVETLVRTAEATLESEQSDAFEGTILNHDWIRDQSQALLNRWYAAGYPDARVKVREQNRPLAPDGTVMVDMRFHLDTGQFLELAAVRVEPEGLLLPEVFERQIDLETGKPFNLLDVEEGRRQLLSLGIFRDVVVEEDLLEPGMAAARYILDPLPRRTLKALVGWGSYELGRVGLSWEQLNLWQRAHRYEFDLKKSFKSHLVEGTYVIPHFFDERVTAYGRLTHEFREEISFDRTTTRFSLGASRQLEIPGAELSVEYAYETVETKRGTGDDFESLDKATVSSLTVRSILDRRNSIIDPVSGYDLNVTLKTASEYLGGEANFHRLEAGTSYHKFLGKALYLHLSFRYGTIFSRDPTSENLPFNERFFPGGENTVRGYQRGEASPITSEGEEIGAESFALGNVELEQRVLSSLSVVVFWDGIGISEEQEAWPREDFLQSVGVGLRWRTPVGPIRLEYGHNIDPRVGDPDGTLHFSVGYPF